MRLTQIVEALLFASDAPLTAADIARIDERLDEDTVEAVVQELRGEYEESDRAFQIYEVAGGYQLLTRPDFAMHLERFETVPQTTRLSNASLEALAIIAYRQPIGRAEVEEIRGVGSSGAIKTLADRNLVEVVGRGEGLGRPLLYGTTRKFLEHFGLRSLEDMPRPDELPVVLRTRPEPAAPADDQVAAEPAESTQAASDAPAADSSAEAIESQPSASSEMEVADGESAAADVADETAEPVAADHESLESGVWDEESSAVAAEDDLPEPDVTDGAAADDTLDADTLAAADDTDPSGPGVAEQGVTSEEPDGSGRG